ncbi:MAG: hypothetical protein GX355_07705 [Globicatella sulfidifaciens]|uniref:Uncharacterized protein n=1 Tax=Globicatella sulfidifaciens TaxID=136093 RepID=A0A7X8H0C7_9LACT|nr:hypothetical protein [Globicatella sulfidifaciens]
MTDRLIQARDQRNLYRQGFRKIEKQKNELKALEKELLSKIEKQKQEIEFLKTELNHTLYRRLVKSKRIN